MTTIISHVHISCPFCGKRFDECILDNKNFKTGEAKKTLARECPNCKHSFDIFSGNNGEICFNKSTKPIKTSFEKIKEWLKKFIP